MDMIAKAEQCDREPIHVPGTIQPHGVMLVADAATLRVRQVAGPAGSLLGTAVSQGATLATLIGPVLAARVTRVVADGRHEDGFSHNTYVGQMTGSGGDLLDVSAHVPPPHGAPTPVVVVEIEPAGDPLSAAAVLDQLDAAASAFQRAGNLEGLCRTAAVIFRRLTGFDRVMVYRFLDDQAGRVLAEERRDGLHSFMHHHFPASDIPAQARALYLHNLVRVIPDVDYVPAPLQPMLPDDAASAPLDMSDSSLRSVSPVHLQYLANMQVRASASFSIVLDGALWGLVACHNETPLRIPFEARVACRTIAATLSREIRSKYEGEGYRQRLRLRAFEDDVVRVLAREGSLDDALTNHRTDIQRLMAADGVAVLRGAELVTGGVCPPPPALRDLATWVLQNGAGSVQATDRLSEAYPPGTIIRAAASGVLSMVLSADEPWLVLWFRAEQVETVNWAGNPHEAAVTPDGALTPRASFELWAETVRGRSRRWTLPEQEAADRLRLALLDVRQNRQMQELNRKLTEILQDKDQLLQQKEFLMGEVNHRVQNSLQLVSSFLGMQARSATEPGTAAALEEARRRLSAVGLVHRRLYRGEQVEVIDGSRYIEELCTDALSSMGQDWQPHLELDLAPVMISTDRAVSLGLVLTELIINVNKYAYRGVAGPLLVRLVEDRASFRLTVADKGVGRQSTRKGFGSRMMAAMVGQLGGTLDYHDNTPGLRAVLVAATDARDTAAARRKAHA